MILIRGRKSWRIVILSMRSSSWICGGLVLFPREIRVVPPPRIVCLRIWPTGRLLEVVERVHLFHLSINCHRWTILCLVHGTSTDRTALNRKSICRIDGFPYTQGIQSLNDGIHLLCQLCFSFCFQDAPFFKGSGLIYLDNS
jgi:hypothetical protein